MNHRPSKFAYHIQKTFVHWEDGLERRQTITISIAHSKQDEFYVLLRPLKLFVIFVIRTYNITSKA